MYKIETTHQRQTGSCRYCKITKLCTIYKITTTKGKNKKIVSWGTKICDMCDQARIIKNNK